MNIKKTFDRLLPPYTRVPLLAVVGCNILTYYGTRPISQLLPHYNLSLPLDTAIPFVPAFSVVYVLAYLQWAAGFVLIARESREVCCRVLWGEIIAKLFCMVCFLVIPTTVVRPEAAPGGFFNTVMWILYRMDAADNLFPSIHCLESWVCFRGALHLKKVGPWYRYFSFFFSLLVFASTVLVKQHVAVDILGGVLAAEVGQQIAWRTESVRLFRRLLPPDET